jgi:hypothetical protein
VLCVLTSPYSDPFSSPLFPMTRSFPPAKPLEAVSLTASLVVRPGFVVEPDSEPLYATVALADGNGYVFSVVLCCNVYVCLCWCWYPFLQMATGTCVVSQRVRMLVLVSVLVDGIGYVCRVCITVGGTPFVFLLLSPSFSPRNVLEDVPQVRLYRESPSPYVIKLLCKIVTPVPELEGKEPNLCIHLFVFPGLSPSQPQLFPWIILGHVQYRVRDLVQDLFPDLFLGRV